MFALPPSASDMGDLQPLAEAIDALCELLHCDREILISGLTEIVRRRAEFEEIKHDLSRGVTQE